MFKMEMGNYAQSFYCCNCIPTNLCKAQRHQMKVHENCPPRNEELVAPLAKWVHI